MLNKIKVTPLAAESFGVRSMCTLVETPDVTVLLDAGVSLAPLRSGFPPHPLELQTIATLRKRIAQAADQAQVVTISHYHFDHHTPSYTDWLVNWTQEAETARQIYQHKLVLMKNPKVNINASQRQRASIFQKTGGKYAKSLTPADGKTFSFGANTKMCFSKAVVHGSENSLLGWVIMATIEYEGDRFMFAPDIQGPMASQTMELIKAENPQVAMIGGPPFYLDGFKVDENDLQKGLTNLTRIVESVPVTILEHHALRDAQWQIHAAPVLKAAGQVGHRVMTAAEYAGERNLFLESNRRQLYQENPPSKEFEKWMHLSGLDQSHTKPPI